MGRCESRPKASPSFTGGEDRDALLTSFKKPHDKLAGEFAPATCLDWGARNRLIVDRLAMSRPAPWLPVHPVDGLPPCVVIDGESVEQIAIGGHRCLGAVVP